MPLIQSNQQFSIIALYYLVKQTTLKTKKMKWTFSKQDSQNISIKFFLDASNM